MRLRPSLFIVILLIGLAAATPAEAQTPRLPAPQYPGATLESLDAQLKGRAGEIPIEAAILRARLLSTAGRFRESADAWREVAVREPLLESFSRIEAVRAALDSGDVAAALAGLPQLTAPVPADIL